MLRQVSGRSVATWELHGAGELWGNSCWNSRTVSARTPAAQRGVGDAGSNHDGGCREVAHTRESGPRDQQMQSRQPAALCKKSALNLRP